MLDRLQERCCLRLKSQSRNSIVARPGTSATCLLVLAVLTLFAFTGCKTTLPPSKSQLEKIVHAEPPKTEAPISVIVPEAPVISIVVPQTAAPTITPSQNPPATNAVVQPPASQPHAIPVPQPAPPKLPIGPDYQWRQVHTEGRYIALTFDDGPNPRNTPALLDILKQRQIPATFFVLGQNAAAYPQVLKRMVAEGHEIANHGWDHQSFTTLTAEQRAQQVRKTSEAVERAVNKTPTLVRPPYGATTPTMNRWLTDEFKLTVVLWSVDSRDWEHRDLASIQREIVSATRPGGIILAHDIHRTTVSAMPGTLDALLAKGYKFVTVSELLLMQGK